MRDGVIEISPGRFREVQGRFFEDFEIGHIYEHRPGRTITDADNVWFTLLTMNTHPAHFDYAFSEKTEFGKPLVASPLTIALMTGMSVSDTSAKAIANDQVHTNAMRTTTMGTIDKENDIITDTAAPTLYASDTKSTAMECC